MLLANTFNYLVSIFICFSVLNWSVDSLTLSVNNSYKWLHEIANCHLLHFQQGFAEICQ